MAEPSSRYRPSSVAKLFHVATTSQPGALARLGPSSVMPKPSSIPLGYLEMSRENLRSVRTYHQPGRRITRGMRRIAAAGRDAANVGDFTDSERHTPFFGVLSTVVPLSPPKGWNAPRCRIA